MTGWAQDAAERQEEAMEARYAAEYDAPTPDPALTERILDSVKAYITTNAPLDLLWEQYRSLGAAQPADFEAFLVAEVERKDGEIQVLDDLLEIDRARLATAERLIGEQEIRIATRTKERDDKGQRVDSGIRIQARMTAPVIEVVRAPDQPTSNP